MEKMLYRFEGQKIGGYSAVSIGKQDTRLIGRRGWIFLANSTGTRLGVILEQGRPSDKIIYCDFKELKRHVSRIDLLVGREAIEYANNPNLRMA